MGLAKDGAIAIDGVSQGWELEVGLAKDGAIARDGVSQGWSYS